MCRGEAEKVLSREALNKSLRDLSRPLVPDAVYHLDRWFQTRSTTYIPVGVPARRRERARRKCDLRLASK